MAGTKSSSPPPVAIGNCKVVIKGHGISCESSEKSLIISVSNDAKIKISVNDSKVYARRKHCNSPLSNLKHKDDGEVQVPSKEHSFLLLNPKDLDSQSKSLLQNVLELYTEELPSMSYAADTGKKSQFLEKCISSGKYRTLVLRSDPVNGCGEVVAAVSYQIVPSNTQYAEIPLAAVSLKNQNMGVGQALYKELRERLENVGVLTIFCWADKTSEGFWLKQGFVSVGDVDRKGKISRLPIKADIRRALSFPGGSMLMVAQFKDTSSCNSLQHHKRYTSSRSDTKSPSCNNNEIDLRETMEEFDADGKGHCFEQRVKRPIWEASLSSLKSKRVRGAHLIGCYAKSNQDLPCDNCFLQSSRCKDVTKMLPDNSTSPSYLGTHDAGQRSGDINDHLVLKENCPRIMFMNIADDAKKIWLTKTVEELRGSVTCDGSVSTHVITGKARRTLNFSVALCSGAWIVSPNWLKASFREGRFLEESQFILEDDDYLLKYKTKLKDAVKRAKANPHSLLRGYHVCLANHIEPSVGVLSAIIQSAGGNVIYGLGCIEEPSKTIFVACEEDMSEALLAAKKGVWTFSSDWLMNCVMKQELDLEAPQFAESL